MFHNNLLLDIIKLLISLWWLCEAAELLDPLSKKNGSSQLKHNATVILFSICLKFSGMMLTQQKNNYYVMQNNHMS